MSTTVHGTEPQLLQPHLVEKTEFYSMQSGTLSNSLNQHHKVTVPYASQFISYPSSVSRKRHICLVQTRSQAQASLLQVF